MGASPVLADAARVKPPSADNRNEGNLAAGVVSAVQALFVPEGPDESHLWISVICTNPFNVLLGRDTVASPLADPTDEGYFGTGAALQFRVTRARLSDMKIRIPLGGTFLWWNSGP